MPCSLQVRPDIDLALHCVHKLLNFWSSCLSRLTLRRFRLGVFDPPERLPWADLGPADVGSKANEQLALEAARKGVPHVCHIKSVGKGCLGLICEMH